MIRAYPASSLLDVETFALSLLFEVADIDQLNLKEYKKFLVSL